MSNEITPKFNIGDKIQRNDCIERKTTYTITDIKNGVYYIEFEKNGIIEKSAFEVEYQYEFVLSDIDPKKFKVFDKVIVRNNDNDKWTVDFFSYKNSDNSITGVSGVWKQYMLYNKYYDFLIGTSSNLSF